MRQNCARHTADDLGGYIECGGSGFYVGAEEHDQRNRWIEMGARYRAKRSNQNEQYGGCRQRVAEQSYTVISSRQ